MKPLIYYIAVSLDGMIADADGDTSMFLHTGDHMEAIAAEFADAIPSHVHQLLGITPDLRRFDTVIMGWDTYAVGLPVGVDSPYAHLRQYVATRKEHAFPDGVEATADPLATVRELKAGEGSGIYLCGGGQLAGALIDEIDELVLKANPVIIGAGRPLFAGVEGLQRSFALQECQTFESGVVISRYLRSRTA